ncbi:hypothetical protein GCM10023191_015500 [Actinoallomurus oryzae]|uniref:Uncharacterized protein n=1 Tax=Actinoallomurus oryzae TaxID=502180 RepID=A0ABP8PKI4_9ACTN
MTSRTPAASGSEDRKGIAVPPPREYGDVRSTSGRDPNDGVSENSQQTGTSPDLTPNDAHSPLFTADLPNDDFAHG